MDKWINTSDISIPSAIWVIAGLTVYGPDMESIYFEQRIIYIDETGLIRNIDWNHDDTWNISDYTHWMYLPTPPEEEEIFLGCNECKNKYDCELSIPRDGMCQQFLLEK